MKLAVSNIAWSREDDVAVAALLTDAGVTGIEVAPTAIWADPLATAVGTRRDVRRWWADRGLPIVSMQALLFGRSDLTVFGSPAIRQQTHDYLVGMMDLAADVGARVLVFGSPKNRAVGDLAREDVQHVALTFFSALARSAADRDVVLCIEPNPREYGCDFVTTAADALALANAIDHPGFGIHLDAGAMRINAEPVDETIGQVGTFLQHFHCSMPFLDPLPQDGAMRDTVHAACAQALRAHRYDGWVSLEMKALATGVAGLAPSVQAMVRAYG